MLRKQSGSISPIIFGLLLVLLVVVGMTRSQAIGDWVRLWGYEPSAKIVQIADETTMNDRARHLFYINHPTIDTKDEFAKNCPDDDEQTIILGCYISGQRGIHIYRVTDKRLDGVEEVTAAHEMLHAAYDRLSNKEKERVNKLLQEYAGTKLTNKRVKEAIVNYRRTEPGQEFNEMHSMFGTEIATLPAELEEYYKQYFRDRSKVVAAAERYQAAFASRQELIKQYDTQLAAWKAQISSNQASLQAQSAELEAMQKQLNAYRAQGDTTSYNANVPIYNAKVDAFNALIAGTKSLIEQHNELVEQRNAIAVEEVELQKALDSSLSPIR